MIDLMIDFFYYFLLIQDTTAYELLFEEEAGCDIHRTYIYIKYM